MSLPPQIGTAIEKALAAANDRRTRIRSVMRVGGGCISPAAHLVTDRDAHHFVKWSDGEDSPPEFFAEEARSLRALNEAAAVRVPAVLDVGRHWLLLEWLDPGRPRAGTWEALGIALAAQHRTTATAFGWDADNYIGSLPQTNSEAADWPTFWLDRRIRPQWAAARRRGFFSGSDQRALDALSREAADLLEPGNRDGPSLLHGDLWGGNVHVMADGTAALIDPSCSYGHREVDLAMARLFGGFDTAFFQAYDEAWPLDPGFDDTRCALYQLYYLLVHVNLFGGSYVGGVNAVLRRFG
jgi:fructosamine-3-kinase